MRYTICLAALILCGCSGGIEKQIVGKWKFAKEDAAIEFTKTDYYMLAKDQPIKMGSYKFIDKDVIEIELSEMGKRIMDQAKHSVEFFRKADAQLSGKEYEEKHVESSNVIRAKIAIDGDKLTMTEMNQKPQEFIKSR